MISIRLVFMKIILFSTVYFTTTYWYIFAPTVLLNFFTKEMFCKAVSTSVKLARVPTVVPVRTLITCTNTDSYRRMNHASLSPMYIQKRTFMGPLLRYATQFLASIGGTSIRAFFQAFQQAAGMYLIVISLLIIKLLMNSPS